jgi:hypothetical protein
MRRRLISEKVKKMNKKGEKEMAIIRGNSGLILLAHGWLRG